MLVPSVCAAAAAQIRAEFVFRVVAFGQDPQQSHGFRGLVKTIRDARRLPAAHGRDETRHHGLKLKANVRQTLAV